MAAGISGTLTMLYVLHQELIPDLAGVDEGVHDGLLVLLRQAGDGKHLLMAGSLAVVRALNAWASSISMDWVQRAALRKLGTTAKDSIGYQRLVRVRVEVGPSSWVRGWTDSAQSVYRLPARDLKTMDQAAATALVTEGDDDGRILTAATRAWVRRQEGIEYNPLDLALRRVLGGGAQLAGVMLGLSEELAPVLCWVDHDGDAPDTLPKSDSTAGKALVAVERCVGPTAVHVFEAKELENLIPGRLWTEALAQGVGSISPSFSPSWQMLERDCALFPNTPRRGQSPQKEKRYAQLKGRLPGGAAGRVAGLLTALTEQKAGELLFAEDDGTWAEIAQITFAWGVASRRVHRP